MAPYNLVPLTGSISYFLVFLLLGMGFGAVLELSGFGDSRRLSAQFYLRDMTVLKVMFTGIVVAAVLVYLAAALQLLDLSRVWINPTYLAPQIIGGLIMGVGFIVGGFCPGTSLVAAATLKLDGIMFVLGGLAGAQLFGESVGRFERWWHSTSLGRFTVYDWLHLPAGIVVLLLVVMALGVFLFVEKVERRYGAGQSHVTPADGRAVLSYGVPSLTRPAGLALAGLLVTLGIGVALKGQPTLLDRWRWIEPEAGPQLAERTIHVDPLEVVDLKRDLNLMVRILEVRSESDFNLFHLAGSRRIALDDTRDPRLVRELASLPDNTILLLASNGETDATTAWKRLRAQGVVNLYVVSGGINGWLESYPPDPAVARVLDAPPRGIEDDALNYRFMAAIGERCASAHPETFGQEAASAAIGATGPAWYDGSRQVSHEYTKRVKIQKKVAAKGGCG